MQEVFYDSTVNNSRTPLTKINWDASDGGYGAGDQRTITIQVNYKNTNTVTDYKKGTVQVTVKNPFHDMFVENQNYNIGSYRSDEEKEQLEKIAQLWVSSIVAGANVEGVSSGYDWTLVEEPVALGDPVVTVKDYSNTSGYILTIEETLVRKGFYEYTHKKYSYHYPDNPENDYSEEEGYEYNKIFNAEYLTFENAVDFSKNDNFEGSFQISFVLTPQGEKVSNYGYVEEYDDSCVHSGSGDSTAVLETTAVGTEISLTSNELKFDYTRTYEHPWEKDPTIMVKLAEPIKGYDNFPEVEGSYDDYTWVKYSLYAKGTNYYIGSYSYPYVGVNWKSLYFTDEFPEECIVFSNTNSTKVLSPDENGIYKIDDLRSTELRGYGGRYYAAYVAYVYVGYPKSIYNAEADNLAITNYAESYGIYYNSDEEECLANASVALNLGDYAFDYDGALYGVTKGSAGYRYTNSYSQFSYNSNPSQYKLWYETMEGSDKERNMYNTAAFAVTPYALYTGHPMDVEFGDDVLFGYDKDANPVKLDDEDYHFTRICFERGQDINGQDIDGSLLLDLYVRRAGEADYTLYKSDTLEDFLDSIISPNDQNVYCLEFAEDENVVGYYFVLHDVRQSLGTYEPYTFYDGKNLCAIADVEFTLDEDKFLKPANDGSSTEQIHDFAFERVYFTDTKDGSRSWQNPKTLENYAEGLARNVIAPYDMETYGAYLQRGTAEIKYKSYKPSEYKAGSAMTKYTESFVQDNRNEIFTTKSMIRSVVYANNSDYGYDIPEQLKQMNYEYVKENGKAVSSIRTMDLLPEHAFLMSSKEDILDSLYVGGGDYYYSISPSYNCDYLVKLSNNEAFMDEVDWDRYYEDDAYAESIEQQGEAFREYLRGRTTITIEENYNNTNRTAVIVDIDLSDDPIYIMYVGSRNGIVTTFDVNWGITYDDYIEYGSAWKNEATTSPTYANGSDIPASQANTTTSINTAAASHQSVLKQVETDHRNYYAIENTQASPESEYSYKLKMTTGTNDITDIVFIDNLEQAYGNYKHWKGSFLGVDTSYIENKTWKLYDPTNENADSNGYVTEHIDCVTYYSTDPEETDLYETTTVYNDNSGHSLTYENGEYYYTDDNEDRVVVDEANVIARQVRKTDSEGNYIKNSNWKELTDDVDLSTVKSIAVELLNRETGKPATLVSGSSAYVTVSMKAPAAEEGYYNSKVLYSYNNYRTQWTPLDDFGRPLSYIVGITSNTVKVYLHDMGNVTVKKVDQEGNLLEGATLQILDKDKNVVEEFESTEEAVMVTDLMSGIYTLHEVKAPAGYFIADDVEFTIENDDVEVVMTDKRISLLPSTGGKTALLLTLTGALGIAGYGIYETLKRRKRNKQ